MDFKSLAYSWGCDFVDASVFSFIKKVTLNEDFFFLMLTFSEKNENAKLNKYSDDIAKMFFFYFKVG